MAKKIITGTIAFLLLFFSSISGSFSHAEGTGHIVVQVLLKEHCEAPTLVTLTEKSTNETYQYIVTEEGRWFITDHIPIGEYNIQAEIYPDAAPKVDYSNKRLQYATQIEPTRVAKNNKTYFTILAGPTDFIDKYRFLCTYLNDQGIHKRGVITEEEAKKYLADSLPKTADIPPTNNQYITRYYASNKETITSEATALYDPEYDYGIVDQIKKESEEEMKYFEPIPQDKPSNIKKHMLIIVPAMIIAGIFAAAMVRSTRKERLLDGHNG